ncbi:MAG: protein-disulfide reductase DsbD family protein [Cytophagaceae bacterium]
MGEKMKAWFYFLLFTILLVNPAFPQGPSREEAAKAAEHIERLLIRDSLNNLIIDQLKERVNSLEGKSGVPGLGQIPGGTMPQEIKQKNLEVSVKQRGGGAFEDLDIWTYLLFAIGSGLLALITPCVFPMIPMTVSFFTSTSSTRADAVKKALVYGLAIVLLYMVLGFAFGPALASLVSTHWLPNILFSLIFVIFALSFLGMFEITLPSRFVNRVDKEADKGGYYGVFFMALTLVLVSFSCTLPIVSNVVLLSWEEGRFFKPILGLVAYAVTFAIPFTIFALFPSLISKLPKSGGWLNVVKVTLGFLELALAMKFLSVADQVYHWGILDREIYVGIWFVLAVLLGVYYLGKLRLPHDNEEKITSVPRLMLAIASFSFAMYLFPGMFGAPLKALSGYLPPMSTHDFDLRGIIREHAAITTERVHAAGALCDEPKYPVQPLPHGLKGYYWYEQARECAKEKNMPLFLDFTGHGCVNCRKVEEYVWADPRVLKLLRTDFIIASLYYDDRAKVDSADVYTSPLDGKRKTNLGSKNIDFQIRKYQSNAAPMYVVVDPFTEETIAGPVFFEENVDAYLDFLQEGIDNFRKLHPTQ